MNTHTIRYNDRGDFPSGRPLALVVLYTLWQIVRLPVLAVLFVLEPFISLVLTAFGLLGIVVALILKFSGDLPHFPFWLMMAFSIGAILILMAYRALISLFSR
jgi:hypothetical protein